MDSGESRRLEEIVIPAKAGMTDSQILGGQAAVTEIRALTQWSYQHLH